MKKLIGVVIVLLTLLLTVIYRQLAGSRVKDRPGITHLTDKQGHPCALRRLREELPLFQLLMQ